MQVTRGLLVLTALMAQPDRKALLALKVSPVLTALPGPKGTPAPKGLRVPSVLLALLAQPDRKALSVLKVSPVLTALPAPKGILAPKGLQALSDQLA